MQAARDAAGPGSGPSPSRRPVKAVLPALDRAASAREGLAAIVASGLAHLRANEAGLLAGRDPEYLHQMRVALRRLRSAFAVFSKLDAGPELARARAELKWLASRLGPARDWDVFATETLPRLRQAPGAPALDPLLPRLERQRRAARRRAQRAVASARYARLSGTLAQWALAPPGAGLDVPLAPFAAAVLQKRCRRVLERGRAIARLDAAERHALRIAVKRYRYANAFLGGLGAARGARGLERRLARLQDILGAMNDAAVAVKLVEKGCTDAPGGEARRARRLAREWKRRREAALKSRLLAAWRDFRAGATRSRIAAP